ncbi:MAG: hypothetical protein IPP15_23235 [Saprospiraceae bacterium]|uniref:Uncharacterized protein n=1 Tax=Candidatus Opimibacter skivensis TaxID=2982028 RepID=A0A9D7XRK1_9BACT|nr:hypothetical protein [Candidatus Opimibacter skivensis]
MVLKYMDGMWYSFQIHMINRRHGRCSTSMGQRRLGTIAGSAAILKDDHYLYAFGAVEPTTHEVYLLRWDINEAYAEILQILNGG